MSDLFISNYEGFQWDTGNRTKNWEKHKVSIAEIEEAFMNSPLFFFNDTRHSEKENRILALGKSFDDRLLSLAFTIRNNTIRVISARDMSGKERKVYEENAKKNSTL
jgi:hypothetical protein